MIGMTTTAGKTTSPLTLILGGTGKTGRRIVDRLADRGVPTRVGSRSGAPPFDWEDGATWAPAVHGVHAAYISYYPDLAVPGSVDSVDAFTGTAVRQGVQKLVLLSGRGEEEAQEPSAHVHGASIGRKSARGAATGGTWPYCTFVQ